MPNQQDVLWQITHSVTPYMPMRENGVISSISPGLNRPEGESTCEGYDLRKHGNTLPSQTIEPTVVGVDGRHLLLSDGTIRLKDQYQ